MEQGFFARQNSLVKLIYILITTLAVALAPLNRLLILAALQFLFISVNFKIILSWLNILLKLLPFFISLLGISLIFNTPFDLQLIMIARIMLILLLSVLLLVTSSIDNFLADTNSWGKHGLMNDLRLFLVSTMFFIPIFIQAFQKKKSTAPKGISILPEIIRESFSQIRKVEEAAVASLDSPGRKFDLAANLIPFFLIIINCVILFC
ncbi:MAG: hypothetical protein Q7J16_04520 [Candidatus Cloacimonadales bacterium]|nr:hypothetical protein [Candidatus Cloacimonadales bacterium]